MNEDRKAILLSVTVHALLILIAWFLTVEPQTRFQTSMLEVTYGELEQGSPLPPNEPQEEVPEETTPEPPEEVTEEEQITESEPEDTEPIPEPEPTQADPEPEPDVEPQQETVEPQPDPVPDSEATPEMETPDEAPSSQPEFAIDQLETEPETPSEEAPSTDAAEGDASDDELQSPYELKWEGELGRDPRVQPLPVNRTNTDATITIRFEVNPDGSIGRTLPIQRMNPELEREVMRTLRNWRFNPLPSRVPQEAQWGTITFRFVVE